MRNRVSVLRSRLIYQAATVVLLAGASASCSDSLRFQEPFFTGSTENQREIIGQYNDTGAATSDYQPMPQTASNDDVSRSDLPPPSAPAQTYAEAAPAQSYDAPVTDGAYEWTAVGGRVIKVGPYDNAETLTAKYGVPEQQILSANQLSSAAQVTPGRVIVIPRRVAISSDRLRDTYQAPVASAEPMPQPAAEPAPPVQTAMVAPAPKPAPQATATASGTYVVQPGETLFGVARKYSMAPRDLAALNNIGTDTMLQVGQTLRVKGTAVAAATPAPEARPTTLGAPPKPLGQLRLSSNDTGADAATSEPKIRLASPADTAASGQQVASGPKIPAAPQVATDAQTLPATKTVATADVDDAIDPASADGTSFRWPVRGRIISGYGAKPNGERNDGINLAVPEGTSVKSVEAGTVIYAGNELKGYGNLVLIRHADGWVSAYAHNEDIMVKRGDTVRRGQVIAHAGMTGSVNAPQVHFELRKGAKPVNPLDYLAGA